MSAAKRLLERQMHRDDIEAAWDEDELMDEQESLTEAILAGWGEEGDGILAQLAAVAAKSVVYERGIPCPERTLAIQECIVLLRKKGLRYHEASCQLEELLPLDKETRDEIERLMNKD